MQTVTLTMGSWLRRLVVRNPLVRASDRIEAAAIFVAIASAVLVMPVRGRPRYSDLRQSRPRVHR